MLGTDVTIAPATAAAVGFNGICSNINEVNVPTAILLNVAGKAVFPL